MPETRFPDVFTREYFKKESPEELARKVRALVAAMTEEEKLSLMHGADNPERQVANGGFLPGIPRLGVPEIRMFDGASGVTFTRETTGLPIELCLASTFDPEMAYLYGKVCGSENRAASGNMQLGCQMDLVRALPSAVGNMIGEDMTLGAKLAACLARGIQDENCVAVAKHLGSAGGSAGNTNQYSEIDEQTLHERILPVMESAVKEGGAGAIMAAYDKINDTFITQSDYILNDVLHDMWGWEGLVMSDWGANHALTTAKGTDIEMPTAAYNSDDRIRRAIGRGRLTWEDVDRAAGHVLYGLGTAGYLSLVTLDENGAVIPEPGRTARIRLPDTLNDELLAENAEYACEIARRGIVLLKNENGTLPLKESDDSLTAVIGLTGMRCEAGDGAERSFGTLHRMISPYEALRDACSGEVRGAVAMDLAGTPIPADCLYQDEACTKPGLVRTYGIAEADAALDPMLKMMMDDNRQNAGGSGKEFFGVADADPEEEEPMPFRPLWIKPALGDMEGHETGTLCCVDPVVDFTTGTRTFKNGPEGTAFQKGALYTWKGYLRVPADGLYTLCLHAVGGDASFRIWIDGREQMVGHASIREGAHWPWSSIVCTDEGMDINCASFQLKAGQAYPIAATAMAELEEKDFQIQLAWIDPAQREAWYAEALELAEAAGNAIVFVSPQDDPKPSSGPFDMFSPMKMMDKSISGYYQRLIHDVAERVHARGGRLTVVINIGLGLCGGVFVPGPWLDECDALVEMWTAGQEGSRALTDILLGRIDPSGRMPVTIPFRNEDGPLTDSREHMQTRLMGAPEGGSIVRHHDEGILFGYRWYDRENIAPCFPFGFGLSYTTFELKDLQAAEAGAGFDVTASVTNTGTVPGDCIPQLYLGAAEAPEYMQMADKQLVDFVPVRNLQPGETRTVRLHVSERALSKWDIRKTPDPAKWRRMTGQRVLYLGQSSADLPLQTTITVS